VTLAQKYDPLRIAQELREQIGSASRRLGFFLGAGASIAAGIPGLDKMTNEVESGLPDGLKQFYQAIAKDLASASNLETILNRVRLIRELSGSDKSAKVAGLTADEAKKLDVAICAAIFGIVSDKNTVTDYHKALASWIRQIERDCPVEVFTTNYDLLLETAFESLEVPYFDGFVGAIEAFFVAEAVEADGSKRTEANCPPKSWTRLWKIHGSVGWQLVQDPGMSFPRIIRASPVSLHTGAELLIYPSREKYIESRKLPFLMYLDRLREFLSRGEVLCLVCGYSFRDEHLNYVISQGLRSNPRAAVHAFLFEPVSPAVASIAQMQRNLTIFGPDSSVMGGVHAAWQLPPRPRATGEEWPFWDEKKNQFTLGDFKAFTAFLNESRGVTPTASAASSPAVPSATGAGKL
jgi:hypothetical protein